MRRSGDPHSSTPERFLRAFRRRSLLIAALRLALMAAVVNEAVRWIAILSNNLLDTELPVLNIGPLLFAVTVLFAARRWSPNFTASKADAALDFRDRLVSWVDFSYRRDLSPVVVRAQEEEVASSLEGAALRRILPFKPLLAAGPLLLALSVFYPNFFLPAPFLPRIFQTAMVGPPPSPSSLGTPPHAPREGERGDVHGGGGRPPAGDEAKEGGEETGADALPQAKTPISAGDPAKEPGRASERRRPTVQESDVEENPIVSKTVGRELSPVVEPLYTPGGQSPESPPELPAGTVSFRLLPRAEPGGGQGGGNSSAEAPAGSVVIDLDGIPERYRTIVREYFALLVEESDRDASREYGKERR